MEPRVSVVIPTLGRASLERALQSVSSQTRPPNEIWVIDNGPTDRHPETRRVADSSGVNYRSIPPFSGPGATRNMGAWCADGDLVAFLDDDDWFEADYLHHAVIGMARDGADIGFTTKRVFNADGNVRRVVIPSDTPPHEWLDALLGGRNPGVGGQNLLVRRTSFFEVGGFPVDLTSAQDRFFTMRALRAGQRLTLIDDAVVCQTQPAGFRASGKVSNWHNELKLLMDNWSHMTVRQRLRSSARFVSAVARLSARGAS